MIAARPSKRLPLDPFREVNARRDALRELKRAVINLGNSGDRLGVRLARHLFKPPA